MTETLMKYTSDGIPERYWSPILSSAVSTANFAMAGKLREAEASRVRLIEQVNSLIRRFGKRPSLLATKADYVKRSRYREALLTEAYGQARRKRDKKNLTLISSSLTQFYLDEMYSHDQLDIWAGRLSVDLRFHFDRDEAKVLRAAMKRLRSNSQGMS